MASLGPVQNFGSSVMTNPMMNLPQAATQNFPSRILAPKTGINTTGQKLFNIIILRDGESILKCTKTHYKKSNYCHIF